MPVFIRLTEYFRDCPVYINIMDISLIANPGALIEEGCDVKLKS